MRRQLRRTAAMILVALLSVATAQTESTPAPPPAPPPAASGGAESGSGTGSVDVAVAIDTSGGAAGLVDAVTAAVDAWRAAAPGLATVTVESGAPSTIRYAAPALLGPDTLSIDTRTPGKPGVTIAVSSQVVTAHPMVLLHEVGVLLGLEEGAQGVMAYGVPATSELDKPTSADAAALRASLTYAREDLNRDGRVDFYDLVAFGQAFGRQGVNLPADFNGDGRVDNEDLALLEKAYQFTAPSQNGPESNAPTPAASQPSQSAPSGTTGGTTPPASGSAPGSSPP